MTLLCITKQLLKRDPPIRKLHISWVDATGLDIISEGCKRDLASFNAKKTQFLNLSTHHNLPNIYTLFLNNRAGHMSSDLHNMQLHSFFIGRIFFLLSCWEAINIMHYMKI